MKNPNDCAKRSSCRKPVGGKDKRAPPHGGAQGDRPYPAWFQTLGKTVPLIVPDVDVHCIH